MNTVRWQKWWWLNRLNQRSVCGARPKLFMDAQDHHVVARKPLLFRSFHPGGAELRKNRKKKSILEVVSQTIVSGNVL